MSVSFAEGDLKAAAALAAAGRTPPHAASPLAQQGGGSLSRAAAAASPGRDPLQVWMWGIRRVSPRNAIVDGNL